MSGCARWTAEGAWNRILTQVQAHDDAVGTTAWAVSVDSAVARAHRHAAGAREKRVASHRAEVVIAAVMTWLR